MSAALAPWVSGLAGGLAVAVATGGALGVATVSLAALLPGWCGVVWVGLGTGMGYGLCNVPWVFTQTPVGPAWVAGLVFRGGRGASCGLACGGVVCGGRLVCLGQWHRHGPKLEPRAPDVRGGSRRGGHRRGAFF